MENKKIDVGFKDGALEFGLDADQDGIKSLEGKLFLNEALEEAINKGEAIEGAKVVDFRFEGMTMILILDTDKDGEKLLELKVNLMEGFDEGSGALKKK